MKKGVIAVISTLLGAASGATVAGKRREKKRNSRENAR